MNHTHIGCKPLRDALKRVDPSDYASTTGMPEGDPVELLLTGIDRLYAAYNIACHAGSFSAATAAAFHDKAIEYVAAALQAIDREARWHYNRDNAPETATTIDPETVGGYPLGRRWQTC